MKKNMKGITTQDQIDLAVLLTSLADYGETSWANATIVYIAFGADSARYERVLQICRTAGFVEMSKNGNQMRLTPRGVPVARRLNAAMNECK